MECIALKKVREEMGLDNVEIMVPFVRTLKQAEKVVGLLEKFGLKRGENGLRLIMMCEVPSNAILAEEFLQFFDGFSIGSNDLTQLTLGLDRDSGMELLAVDFDERDPAVQVPAEARDRNVSAARQVRRHLRPGSFGSSGLRRMADEGRHQVDVAESGHDRRHVADAGQSFE